MATSSKRVPRTSSGLCAFCAALILALSGCAEEEIQYTEFKRVEDRVTPREVVSFLAIIDSLPEKTLPEIPPIFLPTPDWRRTYPIQELVQEEKKKLEEHASVEWVTQHMAQSRALKRALRRERMTMNQFVGLALALGMALSRDNVPDDVDLDILMARGKRVVSSLEKMRTVYSSLTEDEAAQITLQAGWITLVDRVYRLKLVPDENRDLAKKHREALKAVLPEDFTQNPLTGLAKLLEDDDIPFEEQPESGSDSHLAWSRDQAIVGGEQPAQLAPGRMLTPLPAAAPPQASK